MTMPILRIGLVLGALGFLYVTWASSGAGFPIEVATVRGMVAFMAFSFVAYLGELVLATAPPVASEEDEVNEDAENDGSEDGETDDDEDDGVPGDAGEQNADAALAAPFGALLPIPARSDDNDEREAA